VISSSVATSSGERSSPIVRPELGHLVSGTQPGEGQRWIYAAREDEVRALRQSLQEERDDPVDALGVDGMVVVEDEI
jgi:hypothetical protein